VRAAPLARAVCHCRTCRKASSAPALPFITLLREDFAFTRGAPAEFHSSAQVTRGFCGSCGSPLTYASSKQPDRIDVMTCSLDNPEAFPPTCHIWTSHRLAWLVLGDGLPMHEKEAPP
jgi:hypothetical protein